MRLLGARTVPCLFFEGTVESCALFQNALDQSYAAACKGGSKKEQTNGIRKSFLIQVRTWERVKSSQNWWKFYLIWMHVKSGRDNEAQSENSRLSWRWTPPMITSLSELNLSRPELSSAAGYIGLSKENGCNRKMNCTKSSQNPYWSTLNISDRCSV